MLSEDLGGWIEKEENLVLILILLDHALRDCQPGPYRREHPSVLILILLDHALRE